MKVVEGLYLPNIFLKALEEINSHVPEIILTLLQVHHDLNLQRFETVQVSAAA